MAKQNQEQQEYNALLKEGQDLLRGINNLRRELSQKPLSMNEGDVVKNIQSLRNEFKGLQDDVRNLDDSASSLYDQLKGVTDEIMSSGQAMRDGRSAFKQLNSAARQLRDDEQGILDLNKSQVEKLKEKLVSNRDEARSAAERLISEDQQLQSLDNRIKQAKEAGASEEEINALISDRNTRLSELQEEKAALIKASEDEANVVDNLIAKANERIALEEKIAQRIGVTGAAVGALNGIMSSLGIESSFIRDAFQESAEAMREAAKNGKSVRKAGLAPIGKAFAKTLFSAELILGAIVKNFFEVNKAASELQRLTGQNSTTLAGFNNELVTSVQVLKTMQELTKQTGMNAQNIFTGENLAQAGAIQNTLGLSAQEAGNLAIMAQSAGTSVDAINSSIVDTTSSFNRANRSAVSQGQILRDVANTSDDIKLSLGNNPKLISEAASAARRLGMDLGRVDQIASSLMDFESSIEAELEAQLLTGKNINMAKARELALNNDLAGLSKEIFKNSADVAEFGKMNRIQQEAQAKALGISRQELGKMAYQRALEAGMTADQAAAAANVKKEDMERLAVQEKLQLAATKLAQAFAPMLEILVPIVDIIAGILKPIGYVIGGIFKLTDAIRGTEQQALSFRGILASIAKFAVGTGILLLGKSIRDAFNPKVAGGFFANIKKNFSGMGDMVKGAKEKIKSLFTKEAGDKAKGITQDAQGRYRDSKGRFAKAPKTDKVKDVSEDVSSKASKASEGTEKISTAEPKSKGEGIKEYLTNLAEGLKAMGNTKVLGGALNLIPASIGFVAFIPGAVGAKLMEYLNGPKLQESLTGLAEGLKSMGNAKTVLGALALIPASLGMLLLTPAIPIMYLLSGAGAAASGGLIQLAAGLTAMSGTLAGVGALAAAAGAFILMIPGSVGMALFGATASLAATGIYTLIPALVSLGAVMLSGVGAVGLAALAAGAIALGAALLLASPAISAFGTVIEKAFGGIAQIISATASGISQILDAVTLEKAAAMLALGPALLGVSAGLIGLSAASMFALPGIATLGALSLMASPLGTLGNSLTVVAAGIAAVATALNTLETEKLSELKDLVMTTAVAAPMVAASGAITEMIAGIAGSSKKEGEGQSNTDLINKIDELIAVVKQGGDVYIDGNKAGQALVLASSKLS